MDTVISSGSQLFDQLLNGGYETNVITTVYGPAGSGKSTLSLLAAIAMAKTRKKVIFIDTEGGFSVTRIMQLCDNNAEILEKILIFRPTSFNEQMHHILKLKSMINEKIGIIIVDTISMLYRLELGKNEGVKHINNQLSIQIAHLTDIARTSHIPILLTNQVYSDFEIPDNVKMVGGDLLDYGSKCLIELRKFRTKRAAIIKKHRSIEEGRKIIFQFCNKGILEAEPETIIIRKDPAQEHHEHEKKKEEEQEKIMEEFKSPLTD